jgi:hypothetical protein
MDQSVVAIVSVDAVGVAKLAVAEYRLDIHKRLSLVTDSRSFVGRNAMERCRVVDVIVVGEEHSAKKQEKL